MIDCYIIKSQGKDYYLTPFYKRSDIDKIENSEKVVWHSAESWDSILQNTARKVCYREIDDSMDTYINDVRYYPRLFASAAVFVVLYFFFTFVVRDPIPIIPEVIGSSIGAGWMWNYMKKHDSKSEVVEKHRLELKQMAGECTFVEDPSLVTFEVYLDNARQIDLVLLCDQLCNESKELLAPLVVDAEKRGVWLRDIYWLIMDQKVDSESKGMIEKVEKLRSDKEQSEKLASRLLFLARNGKIDLSQVAFLVALDALIRSI